METILMPATPADYRELLELWEDSVRSTHRFLAEEDIRFYRPRVRDALLATELYLIRNREGRIVAFAGLGDGCIEMLFVRPGEQKKGYGKQLVGFATGEKKATRVDVNEQNEEAFRFYKHLGFRVTSRDALDPSGKPFPILHLRLLHTPDLTTPRLMLRPFTPGDAEAVFECCRNPNLGNNAGWKPHETLGETEKILADVFMSQENIWAIVTIDTGRLVGSVGLIADPKRENPQAGMLGYWLEEPSWGKGYMTEAVAAVIRYGFDNLHLQLISAYCYPHNLRSQRVLERQGFLYEGRLHQAERICTGQVYDHLCYYLPVGKS